MLTITSPAALIRALLLLRQVVSTASGRSPGGSGDFGSDFSSDFGVGGGAAPPAGPDFGSDFSSDFQAGAAPAGPVFWCFIDSMPDGDPASPYFSAKCIDNVVTVYNRTGHKDGRFMRGGVVLDRAAIQVKVRAGDPVVGWQKMKAICDVLDAVRSLSIVLGTTVGSQGNHTDGTIYTIPSVTRTSIIPMGREPGTRRRFFYAINCTLVCDLPVLAGDFGSDFGSDFQGGGGSAPPSGPDFGSDFSSDFNKAT